MKKILIIIGDTNDGDYITSINEITEETVMAIQPVIEAIQAHDRKYGLYGGDGNWPDSEYSNTTVAETYEDILTDEQMELFQNYCPRGCGGIHRVVEIRIFSVADDIKLY